MIAVRSPHTYKYGHVTAARTCTVTIPRPAVSTSTWSSSRIIVRARVSAMRCYAHVGSRTFCGCKPSERCLDVSSRVHTMRSHHAFTPCVAPCVHTVRSHRAFTPYVHTVRSHQCSHRAFTPCVHTIRPMTRQAPPAGEESAACSHHVCTHAAVNRPHLRASSGGQPHTQGEDGAYMV